MRVKDKHVLLRIRISLCVLKEGLWKPGEGLGRIFIQPLGDLPQFIKINYLRRGFLEASWEASKHFVLGYPAWGLILFTNLVLTVVVPLGN